MLQAGVIWEVKEWYICAARTSEPGLTGPGSCMGELFNEIPSRSRNRLTPHFPFLAYLCLSTVVSTNYNISSRVVRVLLANSGVAAIFRVDSESELQSNFRDLACRPANLTLTEILRISVKHKCKSLPRGSSPSL